MPSNSLNIRNELRICKRWGQVLKTITKPKEIRLMVVKADILEIANQASLVIVADHSSVAINHKLSLGDKSIWGLLLFLFGGIFLIALPFLDKSDTVTTILFVIIGLLVLTVSILTIIQQVADKVKINSTEISFRYKLKFTSIPINESLKVKMNTETMEIRRAGTPGSTFILVTHYLH